MSQYALSVTLATFLPARPPPTKIRVTLSIKTFARGSSFPHSRFRLARPPLQKTRREKKIRVQRNNELHEKRTRPGGRKLQFSMWASSTGRSPRSPALPSPLSLSPLPPSRPPFTLRTFLVRPLYGYFSLYRIAIFKSTSVALARHSYTIHATTRREWKKRKWQPWTSSRYSPWVKLWLATTFCYISVLRRELHYRPSSRKKFDHVAIRWRSVDSPCDAAWWQWPFAWRTYSVPDVSVFLFLVERRPCFRLFSAPCSRSLLSRSVLLAYRFSLLVGVTLLAPPKARIIKSETKAESDVLLFVSLLLLDPRSCPCRWFPTAKR